MLYGRGPELGRIDAAIDAAAAGGSAIVVLVGEPGIGKSSLLAEARDRAGERGLEVLRAHGIESESSLAFGGLSELLAPTAELRDRLPEAQRAALGTALALETGPAPDRFAVAAGVLSLLSLAAEDCDGLLVTVDDAQWLDRPSLDAILFAARRLGQDGVAIAAASRPDPSLDFSGESIELLELEGLAPDDAARLLEAGASGLGDETRDRLVQSSAGNPLALIEAPRVLTEEQLAGIEPLPEMIRPGPAIERSFRGRVAALPEETRAALVVAAAAEDIELDSLERALDARAIDPAALRAAEAERVISSEGGRVTFAHPVLRAVAYHEGVASDRREAHAAIAAALPASDLGRRALHRSEAAAGPDEEVAAELLTAAEDARARGALGSAGELAARAAELTEDPTVRVERTLVAIADLSKSGNPVRARALAEAASGLTDDPYAATSLKRARAQLVMRFGEMELGHQLFLEVTEEFAETHPAIAARALIEASLRDRMVGAYDDLERLALRAIELAAAADPPDEAALAIAEVQRAIVAILVGEPEGALVTLQRHEELFAGDDPGVEGETLAAPMHAAIWAEDLRWSWRVLARMIDRARSRSALTELIYPLAVACQLEYRLGNLGLSQAHGDEAIRLATDSRQVPLIALAAGILAETEAALGLGDQCREHALLSTAVTDAVGATAMGMWARVALGLLALVEGDAEAALGPLEECEAAAAQVHGTNPQVVHWRANLIEARARLGRTADAERVLEELERSRETIGGGWTTGAAARGRGLLGGVAEIDEHFEASVRAFNDAGYALEEARSALLWGERLRRARRRSDSREPLRRALELFERAGSRPLADRARRELEASGETVAGRAPELRDRLTPHELRIALRVAEGRTNPEVASELFVSRKTVEHHLSQIYRKLGVRSRTELARVLAPGLPAHPESARALADPVG